MPRSSLVADKRDYLVDHKRDYLADKREYLAERFTEPRRSHATASSFADRAGEEDNSVILSKYRNVILNSMFVVFAEREDITRKNMHFWATFSPFCKEKMSLFCVV